MTGFWFAHERPFRLLLHSDLPSLRMWPLISIVDEILVSCQAITVRDNTQRQRAGSLVGTPPLPLCLPLQSDHLPLCMLHSLPCQSGPSLSIPPLLRSTISGSDGGGAYDCSCWMSSDLIILTKYLWATKPQQGLSIRSWVLLFLRPSSQVPSRSASGPFLSPSLHSAIIAATVHMTTVVSYKNYMSVRGVGVNHTWLNMLTGWAQGWALHMNHVRPVWSILRCKTLDLILKSTCRDHLRTNPHSWAHLKAHGAMYSINTVKNVVRLISGPPC